MRISIGGLGGGNYLHVWPMWRFSAAKRLIGLMKGGTARYVLHGALRHCHYLSLVNRFATIYILPTWNRIVASSHYAHPIPSRPSALLCHTLLRCRREFRYLPGANALIYGRPRCPALLLLYLNVGQKNEQ